MYAYIKHIRKTNELVYATATVELELLGYTIKNMCRKKSTANILAHMKRYTRIYIDPNVVIGIGYILA